MQLPQFPNNPFQIQLSFHLYIKWLEEIADREDGLEALNAMALLEEIAPYPELRDGITDISQLENNAAIIRHLLAQLFPAALTKNEIKAVSLPYMGLTFNYSERFLNILKAAGPAFEINIRDFDDHQLYVMSCCLILNQLYGTQLDFRMELYCDIPTADGIIKHYRILYNADFMEVIPTERALKLSQQDIELLMENYNDLALWKEKFPPGSWIMKGFALMTLVDATVANAVSNLKGNLLGNSDKPDLQPSFDSIFKSLFKIPDIHVGFTLFEEEESKFNSIAFGQKIHSFLLSDQYKEDINKVLCPNSYKILITEHSFFTVSDVSEFIELHPDSSSLAKYLKSHNFQSFILAPVIKNGNLLGILELVSPTPKVFNSINAKRLEIVMPFLVDTIDRKVTELHNQIQVVIQNNYTTLHPSVHWKFKQEAKSFIESSDYALKEIVFENVYPLYGQVDIKGSSDRRNWSVQMDLITQLALLIRIMEQLQNNEEDEIINLKKLFALINDFTSPLKIDTEQIVQHFIETKIHPLLQQVSIADSALCAEIANYFEQLNKKDGDFFISRQKFDQSVSCINQKMAKLLDQFQTEAQDIFPHYYERYKTDGVEHNLYIGAALAPTRLFDINYFYKLRLWQLEALCELEREHYRIKTSLPYLMEITTLILAFSSPISIRFRMDEKRFDVDGTYNARFEIVKKRIDKARIKGTKERIAETGKVTIVYSNEAEEADYIGYLQLLQNKNILDKQLEMLEIEDLQGLTGLKALRVKILHEN